MHVAGHKLVERLNTGACGTVYRASPSAAIKLVPAARVSAAVAREVSILATLCHPNILNLHRVVTVPAPSADAPAALALITELLQGGDLFDAVAEGYISVPVARKVIVDIVDALVYLNSQGVVHADIKLENVCLTVAQGDDPVQAKLIDFGSCRKVDIQEPPAAQVGTPHYLAPELVRNLSAPARPSFATDAWALGVMLYAMFTGTYPFQPSTVSHSDEQQQMQQQETDTTVEYAREAILYSSPRPLPATVPVDIRFIVNSLLIKDPDQRMTIHQLHRLVSSWNCAGSASSLCGCPQSDIHRPSSPISPVDTTAFDSSYCHVPDERTSTSNASSKQKQSLEDMLRVVEFVRNQLPSQNRQPVSRLPVSVAS